jgi:hypothetical protein
VTPLDPAVRDLLEAIEEALERGPNVQRFRVAAAIHDLLTEGSTATPAWAAGFIRETTASAEAADPPLLTRPHDWPEGGEGR